MRNLKRAGMFSSTMLLVGIFLSGCGAAGGVRSDVKLDRVQLSDGNLTCSQIAEKVNELDELEAQYSASTGQVAATNNAVSVVQTAAPSALASIPFAGSLLSIANMNAANNQGNATMNVAKIQARKEHLAQLFMKKECT